MRQKKDLFSDVHEFLLTAQNTALFLATKKIAMDLTPYGGPKEGFIQDFSIQEIDIATNKLLFFWQHDARLLNAHTLSLFDDNCCESEGDIPPQTPPAHGLILTIDEKTLSARVKKTYFHDPKLQVASQGNLQSLKNGNKFIGWGQQSYFSEYRKDGNHLLDPQQNCLYDAQMPGNNISYRAYCHSWKGSPYYRPKLVGQRNLNHIHLFVSWNGSTETEAWKIYGGQDPKHLKKITQAKKKGFETEIVIESSDTFFQVKALDPYGKTLKKSKIIKIAE